ncbi:low molecular weight protein-tyrosine-phosphatase [Variovorax dokdonensis]|uniref:protein-tyrosine-phosphatase n=1 Tax=Variovorax dokdonensis TaxID=344883 RepID=A0ABT7N8W4_9BURK|nr:low molecular weight protein-tyrosine-phosphatase [Variovorax dokdonensis]MDM0044358.1 low molecular weight protein-tyrosine-phosphatase [Variovorax dokdonensis]
MRSILTICIGNICRSPLAEVALARELSGATVWSAGLGALVGEPADPLSVQLAKENGMDLSAHRAQQVNSMMCQRADLILVMEQHHREELERRYPVVRGKVFRLGDTDIADPFRQARPAFELAFGNISRGAASWAQRIRRL